MPTATPAFWASGRFGGTSRNSMTGRTAVALIAWPLNPVKSNDRIPTPQPMNAIFETTTRHMPAKKNRHQYKASGRARDASSQLAMTAAAVAVTVKSPTRVMMVQGIIN
jgi:hypothetical protein